MQLTLHRKTSPIDNDPLVILLDKIMENAPYKIVSFKLGKPVEVEDAVGWAILRTYPDLFLQDKSSPRRNTKVMQKYENKSMDLKAIVEAGE